VLETEFVGVKEIKQPKFEFNDLAEAEQYLDWKKPCLKKSGD